MKTKLMWFILSLSVMSIAATAQTSKKTFSIDNVESAIDPELKPIKNFKRSYPEVTSESWSTDKGYYFVSFRKNGIKNKIAYKRNGQIDYSLKIYNENELPYLVRSTVNSVYYGYKITGGQELKVGNTMIYLVKITDGTTWKTVRMSNGDLEEIENYSSVISPCR